MFLKKFCSCLLCFLSTLTFNAFGAKNKTPILYSDINNKLSIVGPLGTELGKETIIEAQKIKINSKENPDTLKILSINGKNLKKNIEIPYKLFFVEDIFLDEKVHKVKVYQDGAFSGIPDDALKVTMVQSTQYHFKVWLVVYQIIK